jgi:hypothetical protein
MVHAGLDLSRRRLDICCWATAASWSRRPRVPSDADGLAQRLAGRRVRAVIESMNGAWFVHDTLEELGWDVLVAHAQKVIHEGAGRCQGRGQGPRLVGCRVAKGASGEVRSGPVIHPLARAEQCVVRGSGAQSRRRPSFGGGRPDIGASSPERAQGGGRGCSQGRGGGHDDRAMTFFALARPDGFRQRISPSRRP